MTTTSPRPKSVERHALRAGFTLEEIFNLTKIDSGFLMPIQEIGDLKENLAGSEELIYPNPSDFT
jgi:Carbamoyl-phosphate synthetase large chain, oligomerisation domain